MDMSFTPLDLVVMYQATCALSPIIAHFHGRLTREPDTTTHRSHSRVTFRAAAADE